MIKLFVSPTCPRCPKAKELLKEKCIDYEIVDTSTDEGYFEAVSNNIMSAPILLMNGVKYDFDSITSL